MSNMMNLIGLPYKPLKRGRKHISCVCVFIILMIRDLLAGQVQETVAVYLELY